MIARRHSPLLLAALLAPAVVQAQSETRASADVGVNAGYSANPFAVTEGATGSAFVGLEFLPRIQVLTQDSTLTMSGAVRGQQYLRRYDRNDTYTGTIDYVTRPSERVTAHGRLDLSSAVLGAFGNFFPGVTNSGVPGTTLPGQTVPTVPTTGIPPIGDIGLFGLRDRRRSVSASGDVSAPLSARDSVTASVFGEVGRFRRLPLLSNYESFGSTIGYSRQITGTLSAGVQATAAKYDYRNAFGDARSFSLQATGSGRLNELWTLNGALGVTTVDSGGTNSVSLSGTVDLCRTGPLTLTCIQASRQVRPTGIVGTQFVTNLGGTWRYRLSERQNVSLGASYSDIGQDERLAMVQNQIQNIQNKFLQLTASYDRQIRQRLRMTTTLNYRDVFGGAAAVGRTTDYGGQVGLAYRLGDLR